MTCSYLLEIFFEIGPASPAGMGVGPISQTDIAHWQRNTSIRLQPWEARCLRRLSETWVSQSHLAEDPACPPPYMRAPTQSSRARVAKLIDALL